MADIQTTDNSGGSLGADQDYTNWQDETRKKALSALAQQGQGLASTTATLQGRATQLGQQYDAKKQADIGNVRRQAAQSLSAVQGSGSGYGMLQAGMNSGQAITSTSANDDAAKTAAVNQALDAANQARQAQDAFGVSSAQQIKQIGTATDDIDAEKAKIDAKINEMRSSGDYTHWYGNSKERAQQDLINWMFQNVKSNQAREYARSLGTNLTKGW